MKCLTVAAVVVIALLAAGCESARFFFPMADEQGRLIDQRTGEFVGYVDRRPLLGHSAICRVSDHGDGTFIGRCW